MYKNLSGGNIWIFTLVVNCEFNTFVKDNRVTLSRWKSTGCILVRFVLTCGAVFYKTGTFFYEAASFKLRTVQRDTIYDIRIMGAGLDLFSRCVGFSSNCYVVILHNKNLPFYFLSSLLIPSISKASAFFASSSPFLVLPAPPGPLPRKPLPEPPAPLPSSPSSPSWRCEDG